MDSPSVSNFTSIIPWFSFHIYSFTFIFGISFNFWWGYIYNNNNTDIAYGIHAMDRTISKSKMILRFSCNPTYGIRISTTKKTIRPLMFLHVRIFLNIDYLLMSIYAIIVRAYLQISWKLFDMKKKIIIEMNSLDWNANRVYFVCANFHLFISPVRYMKTIAQAVHVKSFSKSLKRGEARFYFFIIFVIASHLVDLYTLPKIVDMATMNQ